ncbi:glycoside hydrolase family 47 protein, partial [Didymella exigua CBS 183.55]
FTLVAIAGLTYKDPPKMYQLLSGVGSGGAQSRTMYEYSDTLLATGNNEGRIESIGQHLICFAGSVLALGGQLIDNQAHFETGRRFANSCAWTYENAPNGIMLELLRMDPCPSLRECEYLPSAGATSKPSPLSEIGNSRYVLKMFQETDNNTRTKFAKAANCDIMSLPEEDDNMEIVWMAKRLKYFHVIFDEPSRISLDDFIVDTDVHPFRILFWSCHPMRWLAPETNLVTGIELHVYSSRIWIARNYTCQDHF